MEDQMQMRIPVFNGDDHEIWSTKMRTLFMSRDLWDVVKTGVSEEKPYQNMGELDKRQKDLKIKDMTALHMLQMSVTDSVFLRIGRATSSKQAWELLKADFGENAETQMGKRRDLEVKYLKMRMTNEERFHDYFEKFMELVNRLRFYGRNFTDDELANRILEGLPSRFDDAVLHIRLQNLNFRKAVHFLRKHGF